MSLFVSLMLCSSNIYFFQTETSEMEKSEERTPPRLVEIISERYNVNLSEAFEILVKDKEKNVVFLTLFPRGGGGGSHTP